MRDFSSIVRDKGIPWVRHWIQASHEWSKNFIDENGVVDFESLGREEFEFREALYNKDFSTNERAKYLWNEALKTHDRQAANGKKGGRPKKSPQDAPNGNAGDESSDTRNGAASKSPTSCDTLTADGDTREDSQAKPDGSAITRNETRAHDALGPSANIYGDAATREGAEVVNSRESGALAPTTVSRNMRRVPQNEAPAHGFSGGRTAQGTMSRSPEAAAQSGKASALDSLPDNDGQSAKTRDTREHSRGRYAPPSCSPEDGNHYDQDPRLASISTDDPQPEGLTGPSHGGSVASLEARQGQARESRRAGGNSVRRVEKVSAPPVRSAGPMPADKQAVYDFAAAEGLDTADAYECWHVTVNERGGLTADGKPIKNWKAYVRKWCRTRANNRRTA